MDKSKDLDQLVKEIDRLNKRRPLKEQDQQLDGDNLTILRNLFDMNEIVKNLALTYRDHKDSYDQVQAKTGMGNRLKETASKADKDRMQTLAHAGSFLRAFIAHIVTKVRSDLIGSTDAREREAGDMISTQSFRLHLPQPTLNEAGSAQGLDPNHPQPDQPTPSV